MAKKRAGWERTLHEGTAGSAPVPPAGIVTQATDVDIVKGNTRSSTTSRGDGTAIPHETEQVVGENVQITFTVLYDDADAEVAALLAAALTGGAIALLTQRQVSGSYADEFDGDVTLDVDMPGPLAGGMELGFTAIPTEEAGRNWTLA